MSSQRCNVLESNKGKSYWLAGDRIRILLNSDQTGGAYAVNEVEVVPDGGPPPHVHTREHELFYVIDGQLQFIKDQTTFRAGKGFAALLPKNVTHTFKNIGATPARALVLAFPGGFDRFTVQAGAPWSGPRAPTSADFEKILAICPQYGIEMRPQWQPTSTVEPPQSDRQLCVLGHHVNLKLTSGQTQGHVCLIEATVAPGQGVPPHSHGIEDELFYVLEGTFRFDLDGQAHQASRGTFVHVPKGAMHGFSNSGESPAKLLDIHTPGGFENFFIEASQPADERPDVPRALELMKKHGMTLG